MINLEDLEAIRMLTHRYSWYFDRYQVEPLVQLFTEDATFDETAFGLGVHRGHQELRTFIEGAFSQMRDQVHFATNLIVDELGEGTASATSYVFSEGTTHSGGSIHVVGYYEDLLTRTPDGWKFTSRKVAPFVPPQMEGFDAHDSGEAI